MDRPPPLRTDGSNEFARYSMQVRVPEIVRDAIARGHDWPPAQKEALEALAREIEDDAPIPRPRPPAPDVGAWIAAHAEHAGETWLDAEWFYAELAVYREVATRSRFWESGRDPFASAKEEEIAGDRPWTHLEAALAVAGTREERLATLIDACLWGNRVDLSYSVAAGREHRPDEDLVVDERAAAIPWLTRPGAHVHLVADNAGTELALDLGALDAVLEDASARATVHVKMQPVFVSDAIAADVWRLVEAMRARAGVAGALAGRLTRAFGSRRLAIAPDPFWSGPRFLWRAPDCLLDELRSATLVLLKGDANYRRLVGDALWPPDAPFARAAAYLGVPLVCARTMKSDSVLGLPPGMAQELDREHPRWRIDGQRGVVQTCVPG